MHERGGHWTWVVRLSGKLCMTLRSCSCGGCGGIHPSTPKEEHHSFTSVRETGETWCQNNAPAKNDCSARQLLPATPSVKSCQWDAVSISISDQDDTIRFDTAPVQAPTVNHLPKNKNNPYRSMTSFYWSWSYKNTLKPNNIVKTSKRPSFTGSLDR